MRSQLWDRLGGSLHPPAEPAREVSALLRDRSEAMNSRWLRALVLAFGLVFSSLAIAASREAVKMRVYEVAKRECCQASDESRKVSSLNRLRLFWAIVPDPAPGES